ncbi:MAG: PEP-CTERM system TPR-repeat protein PrsT [Nitrosomonas sp.]|nr:PEP-CTERM system TPR-repeat protein PrsT [Nitrosomonas sp.]
MSQPGKTRMQAKLGTVLALILIAVFILSACGQSKDAQALVAEAKQHQQKGDDKAAIIQLKNALQLSPEDAEIRFLLGTLYNREGNIPAAEKELSKALSLGMDSVKVLPELGQAWLGTGQFQKVLDETGKLSSLDNQTELLVLRGNALLAMGKFQEAREMFEQGLKENPEQAGALIGMARYSLTQNNIEAAMNFTNDAVTHNPKNSDAALFKGDLLRAQGNTADALTLYEKVISLQPDAVAAYINRAAILIGDKKFDTAQADLETALKLSPGNLAANYTQALLDFSQKKHEAARETLQQILGAAPGHMPSVLLMGATQFALGSYSKAQQQVGTYLKAIPNNLYAIKLMASIQLKNNQAKQSVETLAPALNAAQQDPQLFALAGEAYMRAGEFARATEYFEKADALMPDNAELHTAMAMSKLAQGDSKSAIADLEMASQLDSQSGRAGVMLAMTHLQRQEYNKALEVVAALQANHPGNPLFHNLQGGIYLGKKDLTKARASFNQAVALQADYFPAISNLVRLDLQENDPGAARARLTAVLQKDKKHLQAMQTLAGIALAQGDNDVATRWMEQASEANPDNLSASLQLGLHYLRVEQPKKSLALAKKLQIANGDNLSVIELLARASLANNDKEAALDNFQKLAARMPDSAPAQLQLAQMYVAMQDNKAAEAALKKALVIQPDLVEAKVARARLAAQAGRKDQALKVTREIQQQHDQLSVGFELEGDLLREQDAASAAKAYDKALTKQKSSQLMIKLHEALVRSNNEKQAEKRINEWINEHTTDAITRTYLAGIYLARKQYDPAIKQYQAILAQHPEHAATLNNLAWIYQQQKNPVALEYAEKAYKQAPNAPAIMDTLGWILIEQGQARRGVTLLGKAVAMVPEAAEIRYHFAVGLDQAGDKVGARNELEHLLANEQPFPQREEARKLLDSL